MNESTKIWSVALFEYRNAVQSKAFIVGVVMMPVLMGGALLVQALVKDKTDLSDRRLAVVDRSGQLFDVIARAVEVRNAGEIFDAETPEKQVRPKFLVENVNPSVGEGRIDLSLSERVRAEELFAFIDIGADVFDADATANAEISYHTQTPTFRELPRWLDDVINEEIRRARFERSGLDRSLVEKIHRSVPVQRLGLVDVDAGGEVQEAERENELATFGIPAGAMFLLFMMVMMSAPALLNSVLEEKMQKISEVLVASVTPFQLMMGKLLGTVFVSLTLSILYLGAIGVLLWRFDALHMVPVEIWFWFLLFQLLALLIFGSIFIAIGAACSEIRDAQSLMMPAMMLVMIPMFCWFIVLESPSSPFSRVVSLLPPATPLLMMLRIAIPPGPPWWEVLLGVVLTTAFAILCIAIAGKIFRIGILSQGQTPSLAKLAKWVISK